MICLWNEVVSLGGKDLELLETYKDLALLEPASVEQRADQIFLSYPDRGGELAITMSQHALDPWVLAGACVHPLFGRLCIYWVPIEAELRSYAVETLITVTKKKIITNILAPSAEEAMEKAYKRAMVYPLSKTEDDRVHCIHTEVDDEHGELFQEYWEP